MKIARLAGLLLVAIVAMSLSTTATTVAALPEFKPATGNFSLLMLTSTLFGTGLRKVRCKHGISTGAISSAHLLGPFDITFSPCETTTDSNNFCLVNSPGAGTGIVLTNPLHAVLGLALPADAVGLLLLPTSGNTIASLAANACTGTSTILGSVAGIVAPAGGLRLYHSVTFEFSMGEQIPNSLDTLGGTVSPKLEVLGGSALLSSVDHIKWTTDVEIK